MSNGNEEKKHKKSSILFFYAFLTLATTAIANMEFFVGTILLIFSPLSKAMFFVVFAICILILIFAKSAKKRLVLITITLLGVIIVQPFVHRLSVQKPYFINCTDKSFECLWVDAFETKQGVKVVLPYRSDFSKMLLSFAYGKEMLSTQSLEDKAFPEKLNSPLERKLNNYFYSNVTKNSPAFVPGRKLSPRVLYTGGAEIQTNGNAGISFGVQLYFPSYPSKIIQPEGMQIDRFDIFSVVGISDRKTAWRQTVFNDMFYEEALTNGLSADLVESWYSSLPLPQVQDDLFYQVFDFYMFCADRNELSVIIICLAKKRSFLQKYSRELNPTSLSGRNILSTYFLSQVNYEGDVSEPAAPFSEKSLNHRYVSRKTLKNYILSTLTSPDRLEKNISENCSTSFKVAEIYESSEKFGSYSEKVWDALSRSALLCAEQDNRSLLERIVEMSDSEFQLFISSLASSDELDSGRLRQICADLVSTLSLKSYLESSKRQKTFSQGMRDFGQILFLNLENTNEVDLNNYPGLLALLKEVSSGQNAVNSRISKLEAISLVLSQGELPPAEFEELFLKKIIFDLSVYREELTVIENILFPPNLDANKSAIVNKESVRDRFLPAILYVYSSKFLENLSGRNKDCIEKTIGNISSMTELTKNSQLPTWMDKLFEDNIAQDYMRDELLEGSICLASNYNKSIPKFLQFNSFDLKSIVKRFIEMENGDARELLEFTLKNDVDQQLSTIQFNALAEGIAIISTLKESENNTDLVLDISNIVGSNDQSVPNVAAFCREVNEIKFNKISDIHDTNWKDLNIALNLYPILENCAFDKPLDIRQFLNEQLGENVRESYLKYVSYPSRSNVITDFYGRSYLTEYIKRSKNVPRDVLLQYTTLNLLNHRLLLEKSFMGDEGVEDNNPREVEVKIPFTVFMYGSYLSENTLFNSSSIFSDSVFELGGHPDQNIRMLFLMLVGDLSEISAYNANDKMNLLIDAINQTDFASMDAKCKTISDIGGILSEFNSVAGTEYWARGENACSDNPVFLTRALITQLNAQSLLSAVDNTRSFELSYIKFSNHIGNVDMQQISHEIKSDIVDSLRQTKMNQFINLFDTAETEGLIKAFSG